MQIGGTQTHTRLDVTNLQTANAINQCSCAGLQMMFESKFLI